MMETTLAIVQLIEQLAVLSQQAYAAHTAGDQATLDQIHQKTVAMSNALAPAGAPIVQVD